MKALVFQGQDDVRLMEVPSPSIQSPTDVILRVTASGVCGTDLHLIKLEMPMQEGEILGHEFTGVVEEAGEMVRRFKPGDRVVSCMFSSCGTCYYCLRGWYVQCENLQQFGCGQWSSSPGGGQAELVRVPLADQTLEAIPEGVSDEQALFVGDILATALFGAERADIAPGNSVAVIGAGPVGLLTIQCARLLGAARVFAIDRVQDRLELARELGAIPIDASQSHPVEAINRATADKGVDSSVECVGAPETVEIAIHAVRGGGTVSIVGYPLMVRGEFPYMFAWLKDLTVRAGYCNVRPHMRPLLDLIQAGRIDPTRIISHRMRLEEGVEAYRIFGARQATKVVLTP